MTFLPDIRRRLAAALFVFGVGSVAVLVDVGWGWEGCVSAFRAARWDLSYASGFRILSALLLAYGLSVFIRSWLPDFLSGAAFGLGKALAFFPVTCLAWSFLGYWIGQLGHPVFSLMPVSEAAAPLTRQEGWAHLIWLHFPLVALLALPLTGQFLSLSLEKESRARDLGLAGIGLLALAASLPLEDILGLEGSGSALVRAFRLPDAAERARTIWMLTATGMYLAVCMTFPTRFWPQNIVGRVDGLRFIVGSLCKLGAWVICLLFSGRLMPSLEAGELFDQPSACLLLGLKPMLCALSVWGLGHIIQPKAQTPPSHP